MSERRIQRRIRGVLFDLDDTLTDRGASVRRFAGRMVGEYGAGLRSDVEAVVGTIEERDGGGRVAREVLCGHLAEALEWARRPGVEELVGFWREWFPRCTAEREGAGEVVGELVRRGVNVGVVSNGTVGAQRRKVEVLELKDVLSCVVISEEVGMRKPEGGIFRLALERLGVEAGEAMFVGDHLEQDVRGAEAVGMRGVWLTAREGEAVEGVRRVRGLREVLGLVEQAGR